MFTEADLDRINKEKQVFHLRWFNLQFKPAVEKAVAEKRFSKHIAKKLLEPFTHLERKRVPTQPRKTK